MFFRLDSNLLEMQHYSFAIVKFISIFVSIKTNQPIYYEEKDFLSAALCGGDAWGDDDIMLQGG